MAKFRLSASVTVSAVTVVEAETLEQAKHIASGRMVVFSTGHDGYDEEGEWIISEADGSPENIQAE